MTTAKRVLAYSRSLESLFDFRRACWRLIKVQRVGFDLHKACRGLVGRVRLDQRLDHRKAFKRLVQLRRVRFDHHRA